LNAEEFARRGWSKSDVPLPLGARAPADRAGAACGWYEQFRKMERDAGRYPLRTT
jgi:hypothetical protein